MTKVLNIQMNKNFFLYKYFSKFLSFLGKATNKFNTYYVNDLLFKMTSDILLQN